jgi:delta 1-pyrroline-5-carboxylate dehydrogenase
VQQVAVRSPVGGLYVNRRITGAMVDRQAFGGNFVSGGGAEAGGPTTDSSFVDGRFVSEKTSCATAWWCEE